MILFILYRQLKQIRKAFNRWKHRNNVFDSSKAKEELGYTTRSYSETMRDCINWLKETGKLD